ncbi:glycoside hydrolase family 3 N-terminal domain-containing protein [Blastococcus sp. TF02A_35]|uniref:glycoside hydrolase family 3 N-terminal domain-containing protein n=1 Tax=Blastococcus sp. TF02A-35 TaxID=2559612 RepID=UPI001073EEEC|nr:glycoside hydrolase family 3 N-terminal domain-containing protein [Blastococcus sp. TF02A_35]TFV45437.1 glycoside hydrolase family 3 protein [Blastococcus sp. TF02A_35]
MPIRGPLLPALACVALLAPLAGCASTETRTAASTASRTPSPPDAASPEAASPAAGPVDAALAGLDRRERIAQLFVTGVPLDDLARGEAVVREQVGGVFLHGRSSAAPDELAAHTSAWQEAVTGPGLWVAADQEGGLVQTFKGPGFERLPTAVEQGHLPDPELRALGERLGAAMRAAGVNVNLAPVVDVVPAGTEAGNEPIGSVDRQYGSTAAEVATAAAAVADGLAGQDVVPTLKHFPGLGRVQANTDTSADVVDPVTGPDDEQVSAFADALGRSSAEPFVMMSSAVYPRLDPANQAAFSRPVVTGLLREGLGFDGVVISDDLANADAVEGVPPGERAVRFLEAGGTLVLTVDAEPVAEMIDAVAARADEDPAFAALVDDAVRTTLAAKEAAGLLR